jgi:hypothetical protein
VAGYRRGFKIEEKAPGEGAEPSLVRGEDDRNGQRQGYCHRAATRPGLHSKTPEVVAKISAGIFLIGITGQV